jgi:hypothetical protein
VAKVHHEFNPSKFNFNNVGQEEVLFHFEESGKVKVQHLEKAPILNNINNCFIN